MPAKTKEPTNWNISKDIKSLDKILANLAAEFKTIQNKKTNTKSRQKMLVQFKDMAEFGQQIKSAANRFRFLLDTKPEKDRTEKISGKDTVREVETLTCFINNLRRELARVKRHQYELIIYSVKVINFEELQENYSPQALNTVTKKISNLLYETSRETDILWLNREAGKFFVVLTDTQAENSDAIRKRIRDKIMDASFVYHGNEIDVKITIHFLTQKSENEGDPEELLAILG